jgi:2-polyprenyl-3-methyl-5-hydroxy-6-metoxy-1,4-benzoquinol methylase
VSRIEVANRLSRLFDDRSLRGYVYWKVRTDPAYAAVLDHLRGRDSQPLLDLGCGVGVLALFLREHGLTAPVVGIDHDERKIEAARRAATGYRDVDFIRGDARDPLPATHDVVLLDILQYFAPADQQRILENVVRAVPPGGMVIVRQAIGDASWRHRVTRGMDALGRASRWMRAEKLQYPTRDALVAPFATEFEVEVTPLWGRTPFNTYLFVFRKV